MVKLRAKKPTARSAGASTVDRRDALVMPALGSKVRDQLSVPWSRAKDLCATGRVRVNGEVVTDPGFRVPLKAIVEVEEHGKKQRTGELPHDAILYVDREIVVVNKPHGMLTLPFENERDTLADRLRVTLRTHRGNPRGYDPDLGVVHRLDKDTTGVLVFTRTVAAKKHLTQQFREHSTDRAYVTIANGDVREATYDAAITADRGDGLRGTNLWGPRDSGQHAVTHVRPLQSLRGATLVECQLETGRQHQIRIHLSQAGHPIVGEKVYIRDYRGPLLEAPRPMLHARMLGLTHPRTQERMAFETEPPEDFDELVDALSSAR